MGGGGEIEAFPWHIPVCANMGVPPGTFCLFSFRYFLMKHGILFTNFARIEFECMFSFISLLFIS